MTRNLSEFETVEGEVVVVIDDDDSYQAKFKEILCRLGYVVFGFANHEELAANDNFSDGTQLRTSLSEGKLVAICIDGNQKLRSTSMNMLKDGEDTVIYLRNRFEQLTLPVERQPKLISNSASGRTITGTDSTNNGSAMGVLEILQPSE